MPTDIEIAVNYAVKNLRLMGFHRAVQSAANFYGFTPEIIGKKLSERSNIKRQTKAIQRKRQQQYLGEQC